LRELIASPSASRSVDRQVELPHQFLDDPQLLEVLAAKHGHARLHQIEEFQHHGGDAAEMAGAEGTTQIARQVGGRLHAEGLRHRIHLGDIRREHEVAAGGGELLAVGREGAWIAFKVFASAELQRIDEDARNYRAPAPLRQLDQRHMPGVQVAHRRHEGGAGFSGERGAQVGGGMQDLHQNAWSAVGKLPFFTAAT